MLPDRLLSVLHSPPYYGTGRASADAHRQWNRYYRKRAGKPPSIEVEALVNVLNNLKPSINDMLGDDGPFEYATIAVPALPAMYNEDLVDAAKYTGFQLTIAGRASGDAAQYPMSDVSFAHSGMNLTLEGEDMWHGKTLLSVGYTGDMLTAHVCPNGCDSYYAFYLSLQGIADPLLGSDAKPNNELGEDYWSRVSEAIRSALDSERYYPIDTVVVHGASATDGRLRSVLHQELKKSQANGDKLALQSFDPVFAGAIRAAKLGLDCMVNDHWYSCIPDLRVQQQGW